MQKGYEVHSFLWGPDSHIKSAISAQKYFHDDTIRYDTIEEFNVASKAECSA